VLTVVSFFGLLQVINNSSFKAFLELLPWLRELITDFYSSNYASCLQVLEKMKVCLVN